MIKEIDFQGFGFGQHFLATLPDVAIARAFLKSGRKGTAFQTGKQNLARKNGR
jgi:hypothetical protein